MQLSGFKITVACIIVHELLLHIFASDTHYQINATFMPGSLYSIGPSCTSVIICSSSRFIVFVLNPCLTGA